MRLAAARGDRLVGRAIRSLEVTTFLAGLRHDGVTARFVIDGPINVDWFLLYVEQVLMLTLSEGDIVIMDNLPAHKVEGIREAIEAKGARLLYLLACSPDLNRSIKYLPSSYRCCAKRLPDL
jgi:hypothetical protein